MKVFYFYTLVVFFCTKIMFFSGGRTNERAKLNTEQQTL